ncbi:MAG: VTT domain-containing protein [Syntrophobacter sp.]
MTYREHKEKPGRNVFKAVILLLLVILAILLARFSPLKTYLRPDVLEAAVRGAGLWAPVVYIFFSVVGSCLFLPGTLLLALGVALFGSWWGFLYLWLATLGAATMSFYISRTLGRDFAASIAGKWMEKYDDLIERNGFTAVLYMRLMCLPFAPANYGLGLSKVRFQDYFLGTAIGELASIPFLVFFIGTLRDIWLSGDWYELFSGKVALSAGLVALSLLTPKIIGRAVR